MTNKTVLAMLIASSFSASATDLTLDKLINGESIVDTGSQYTPDMKSSDLTESDFKKDLYFSSYNNMDIFSPITAKNGNVMELNSSTKYNRVEAITAYSSEGGDANGVLLINAGSKPSATFGLFGAMTYKSGFAYQGDGYSGTVNGRIYINDYNENYIGGKFSAGAMGYGLENVTVNGEVHINNTNVLGITIFGAQASFNKITNLTGNVYVSDSNLGYTTNVVGANFDRYYKDIDGAKASIEGNVYFNNSAMTGSNIFGVMSWSDNDLKDLPLEAKASVSIFGNSDLTGSNIYGVYSSLFERKMINDITLNIGSSKLNVSGVSNFGNYNFYINDYNKNLANTDEYILNIDYLNFTNKTGDTSEELKQATLKIAGIAGVNKIKVGDSIGLIKTENIQNNESDKISYFFGNTESNKVNVGLTQEATIDYIFDDENKTATAVVKEVKEAEKDKIDTNVKPLAEGRLAALMNAARGNDELVSMIGKNEEVGTFTPMAKISGGVNKYGNSNNNVDSNEYRLIIGSRYQVTDNFYAGLAAEYGISNYDTRNDFSKGNVNGSGNAKNYALSLFAKYTNDNAYAKAAFSFGRTSNEYRSNDVITGSGTAASYDSKASYISSLASVGYIYDVSDTYSFDTSLTYYFTKLNSDSVVIDGDNVKFKDSTSSRINLRESFNYKASENSTAYLAVAYEYEFDSKAKTSINNIDVTAPSAKGSTGIMELGVKGNPFNNKELQLDFNVKGYSGERKGVTASIYAQYNF